MYIYLCVTADIYELPIAVADNSGELGKMLGARRETINSAIYHSRKDGWNSIYKRVNVEEGEDYEE